MLRCHSAVSKREDDDPVCQVWSLPAEKWAFVLWDNVTAQSHAIYALSGGELNKWAHFYWNSSTLSILLLWINVIYFCHWLIHRVFSCNLLKHLVNHVSRNYKIKCFFPLVTLPLGARLSGGGVREGWWLCTVSCQQFLPRPLISDHSLGDMRMSRNLLAALSTFTLQRVDCCSTTLRWL